MIHNEGNDNINRFDMSSSYFILIMVLVSAISIFFFLWLLNPGR